MGKLMNYVDVITIEIRHGHTEKKTIAALCTLRVANIMLTRTHIIYNFLSNEQENKQKKKQTQQWFQSVAISQRIVMMTVFFF